jgi:septum formation protein
MTRLLLASSSSARQAMLNAAGIKFSVVVPQLDESAAKDQLFAQGLSPAALALTLAELKALSISVNQPDMLVLGCDSTVADSAGNLVEKSPTRAAARQQLLKLRGATHQLHSAAIICYEGEVIWRVIDSAKLTMRDFSDQFLADYLDQEWPAISHCVGGYRLEGLGAQLFEQIAGSHFTILGLPLLPVLAWLREQGELRL